MGSILKSICKCGYESEDLLLRGGMMDFNGKLDVPYFCDNCEIVSCVNLYYSKTEIHIDSKIKEKLKCNKCRRKVSHYGRIEEWSLESVEDSENVFEWRISDDWESIYSDRNFVISEGLHYCPKCKNNDMKFISIGNWD